MIIVTGTKRSGTSMWMQILTAAGLPAFGEAFPRNWEATLKDANPDGFYESGLRQGIYWRTNPHPVTGAYFFPEQVERHVVKVFIPGLVKSDRAYIGSVLATVRHWREYESSLTRLYAIEEETRRKRGGDTKEPLRMPLLLEWWSENYALLRDIVVRRYRVHVQSYDGLLRDPKQVITDTIAWLGHGDAAAGIAAVKPSNRTQSRDEDAPSSLDATLVEAFNLLYAAIDQRTGIDAGLIARLNKTQSILAPRIAEAQRAVAEHEKRRRPPADPKGAEPPSW